MPQSDTPKLSTEAEQVIGIIPHWLIRMGILIMTLVFIFVLVVCYFVPYNTTISIPVVLTTKTPPVPIISPLKARVESIFYFEGDTIPAKEPIGLLMSNTDFRDILDIEYLLVDPSQTIDFGSMQLPRPEKLVLGEVAPFYLEFFNAVSQLQHFVISDETNTKINFQKELISLDERYMQSLTQQFEVKKQQVSLARRIFQQDSLFAYQMQYGSSKREFDNDLNRFLQERESFFGFHASFEKSKSNSVSLKEKIIDLRKVYNDKLVQLNEMIFEKKNRLMIEIATYKATYLLQAPIEGTISYPKFWGANQIVESGERVATIIPLGDHDILARGFVKSSHVGQIDIGQDTNVKLEGFPSTRYGKLVGKVKSISKVPDELGYMIEIEVPHGMVSDQQIRIKFVHQIDGNAEIIIGKENLLHKLIAPLFFNYK